MQITIDEAERERLVRDIAEEVFDRLKELISQNKNKNEYLTVEELSHYLKVKKAFIYQKVHSREIPFHKAGAKLRFSKGEIDLWIRNKEKE